MFDKTRAFYTMGVSFVWVESQKGFRMKDLQYETLRA